MYCSISGVAPREPVLSKTGFIFERRLIEEHIQQTGQCPVTNQQLTENDLTDIKGEAGCPVAPDRLAVKICRTSEVGLSRAGGLGSFTRAGGCCEHVFAAVR